MDDPLGPVSKAARLVASRHVLMPADPDGARDVRPAGLVVEGAWIRDVHPLTSGDGYRESLSRLQASVGVDLVDDFDHDLLTPAFIDSHIHLSLGMLRGTGVAAASGGNVVEDLFYKVEAGLTADDVRAFVTMGAYEALLGGTGLVWDHYFHGLAVADALRQVGLTAVVAPTLEDLGGPCTDQVEAQLEATLTLAASGGEGGIYAAFGPHATDTVSLELWSRVAALSEAQGLPVHAHLAQSVEEIRRVQDREGTSPVGLLERAGVLDRAPAALLVHGLYLTRGDLDRLASAQARVHMGFCPRSQQLFAFPADPALWEARGIPWVLATDCAASNDAVSLPRELAACAAVLGRQGAPAEPYEAFMARGGVDAAGAVWAARQLDHRAREPRRAAEALLRHVWEIPGALHGQVRAGALTPGALANLVAWDREHPALWPAEDLSRALVFSAPEGAIRQVMTAGQWRGVRGDFARSIVASDAYRLAREEATARRLELLSRCG